MVEGVLRWLLIVNQPSCADVLKGWVLHSKEVEMMMGWEFEEGGC